MANPKSRIIRFGKDQEEVAYRLGKTAINWITECPFKFYLIRKFSDEIPINIWILIGLIMHSIAEEFWTTNWQSIDSFVGAAVGRWAHVFKEEEKNADGKVILDQKDKPKYTWRERFVYGDRPIKMTNRDREYWQGLARLKRCAKTFATLFWGTSKPLQEISFEFLAPEEKAYVSGRLDMLWSRHAPSGRWLIDEIKTGDEPNEFDWEPPLYGLGWSRAIQDPAIATALSVPDEIVKEVAAHPQSALEKYVAVRYLMLNREDPEKWEVFRAPRLRGFLEFSQTVRFVQPMLIRAEASGAIPLFRSHCKRCEAKAVCDRYLAEQHGIDSKPISIFDPGLVKNRRRRLPAGQVYLLNFDPRSKTGVRKSTRRRDRMR